jgi:hypothetical protein
MVIRNHLSWIKNIIRVQTLLDALHHVQSGLLVL